METIKLISATDLENKVIPPSNWAIDNFLPEGLTILAGAPKSGKSILALNLALALSSGVEVIGKKSKSLKNVLYLPYEDSERRLQDRIKKIKTGLSITNFPQTFFLDGQYPPKLDDVKIGELGKIVEENGLDIVIIDTLGSSIMNNKKKGLSSYMDEYELLSTFQRFALNHKISLLLLHHTRKMKADNIFDEISGTRGITGAADANFILQRNKYNGELYIQGRDLEDTSYELELNQENLTWYFKGISNTIKLTPEQQSIIDVFNSDYEKELKPAEIAKLLDKNDIRPTIGKLLSLGLLQKNAYGKYKIAPIT